MYLRICSVYAVDKSIVEKQTSIYGHNKYTVQIKSVELDFYAMPYRIVKRNDISKSSSDTPYGISRNTKAFDNASHVKVDVASATFRYIV